MKAYDSLRVKAQPVDEATTQKLTQLENNVNFLLEELNKSKLKRLEGADFIDQLIDQGVISRKALAEYQRRADVKTFIPKEEERE